MKSRNWLALSYGTLAVAMAFGGASVASAKDDKVKHSGKHDISAIHSIGQINAAFQQIGHGRGNVGNQGPNINPAAAAIAVPAIAGPAPSIGTGQLNSLTRSAPGSAPSALSAGVNPGKGAQHSGSSGSALPSGPGNSGNSPGHGNANGLGNGHGRGNAVGHGNANGHGDAKGHGNALGHGNDRGDFSRSGWSGSKSGKGIEQSGSSNSKSDKDTQRSVSSVKNLEKEVEITAVVSKESGKSSGQSKAEGEATAQAESRQAEVVAAAQPGESSAVRRIPMPSCN